MNRKKSHIVYLTMIIFSICPLFATAQLQAPRVYEEKGQMLVERASEKLKSFQTVQLSFVYVMENPNQGMLETMEGTLISKGEKYHMQVGDNLFVSDGTTLWAYLDDLDEVHISLVEDTEGAITPTSILEEFGTQYKATFIRQETHKGQLVDMIDLVPNTPQAFFKYRLALDASDSMMVYAIAYDRHGGTYTYTISTIEVNKPVADTVFSFSESAFPGVDVIDLR